MTNVLYIVPLIGIIGLIYTALASAWVVKQDAGDANMKELAGAIASRCNGLFKGRVENIWSICGVGSRVAGMGRALQYRIQAPLWQLRL